MTREDLGGTFEAIGDRVSPGRIIERRKNRLTNGIQSVRYRVMGRTSQMTHAVSDRAMGTADTARGMPETIRHEAQGSPMAAGVIAFGAGFLAAAMFPASKTEREASEKLMERAEPIKEKITESGHDMADTLREDAKHAVTEVKDAARQDRGGA